MKYRVERLDKFNRVQEIIRSGLTKKDAGLVLASAKHVRYGPVSSKFRVVEDRDTTNNAGVVESLKELVGYDAKRDILTEADARKIAEGFHGRESRGKIEIAQRQKYYSKLAILGELEELGILCADGIKVLPIRFKANKAIGISTEDNPDTIWVCAANKQQIQFVDGDQVLTFNAHVCRELELDDEELEKQYVNVGPVYSIVYFADKHHLEGPKYQEEGTSYQHKFGEEGGRLPSLFYDTLNEQILLVGGSYTITDEGIKN